MAEIRKYKHLFFDLDHTLWDFHHNSRETWTDLFTEYDLSAVLKAGYEDFLTVYYRVNDEKWALYRRGAIDKTQLRRERMTDTFRYFGKCDDDLCYVLETEYLTRSPYKTALLPGALEVLEYLKNKYRMHIITNGFNEVQDIKLTQSGLKSYFESIITSEMAGVNKPASGIFCASLERAGAICEESLMIGDSLEADVLGARSYGMDQVYFNPTGVKHEEEITYEIRSLEELRKFL